MGAARGATRTRDPARLRFLPGRVDEKWDVVVGDRPVCTTPCERWVDPALPCTLEYDPGALSRNQYWEVPDLRSHVPEERVQVQVEPTNTAIGLLGLAPGVWMMFDSKGTVHVTPLGHGGVYAGGPYLGAPPLE